ncbi:MAG: ABC transporter substrate-binding protein [Acidobacteriota bacterium]|nr:ABC transporter substrate-binding protein [Acidobacteriota bacterium]
MRLLRGLGIGLFAFLALPALPGPLRVAIGQDAVNLTPYSPGLPETLLDLVYDRLASPSPYLGDARPWLATAIVPEGKEGRSWRIEVREGIRWHDGKPFTAGDVAFTLRYYRDGVANRWTHHTSDTPKLTTIEQIDRRSLRVQCELPCPLFDRVTAADLVILPAHHWKSVHHPHLYRGAVIGTGPYRMLELKPGRFLRLEANPDYFAGTPRVKSIVVSIIRNTATALAALSANELDLVAAPVPPELIDSMARRPGLALHQGGDKSVNAVEIRLNFDRRPFSDPEFRRAMAFAISPKEVLQRVALGHGALGSFPAPSSPWTKPGLRQLSDDPVAAKAILDAKGFRDRDGDGFRENADGSPLRFNLKVTTTEPLHQRAAQVVARQLKAVGLRTRIDLVDPARMRALYGSRQFDLLIGDVTPHTLGDPDQFMQSVMAGYLFRHGKTFPELDALIEDWRAAATPEARIQAGFAFQEMHSTAPVSVMLYYLRSHYAYRPKAHGHWRFVAGMGIFHKWSLVDFYSGFPVPGQP